MTAMVLRNILYAKKVPTVLVEHPADNFAEEKPDGRQDELFALTAQRSAPVLWWQAERPRSAWTEQLYLAERVGSGPRLIPEGRAEREGMFGLLHEINEGENTGFSHYRRLLMSKAILGAGGRFARKYGWTEQHEAEAVGRCVELLRYIDATLAAQEAKGSRFLVGNAVSAADITWATWAVILGRGTEDLVEPTVEGEGLLKVFAAAMGVNEIQDCVTPRIREHRARILKEYTGAPTPLGGTKKPSQDSKI